MSLIQLADFKTILSKCRKSDVLQFLVELHELRSEHDVYKFFRDYDSEIRALVENLYQDVESFFKSIPILLSHEEFLHLFRSELNKNNSHFIASYSKLENENDTPEKVFSRSIYLVEIMLTLYKPYVEKLDDYDLQITPLRRHLFEVSSRLTDLLVKQIVHTDLSKEAEYIDLEFENTELIQNLTDHTTTGVSVSTNPNYIPGYIQPIAPKKRQEKSSRTKHSDKQTDTEVKVNHIDYFLKAHDVLKLTGSLKWEPRIINEFIQIFSKVSELNLGTNKLYAVFGKFLAQVLPELKMIDKQSG